ncbi:MAG: helix-turn-helix domain-containing protein [Clostridia bacterium]|nr:helix-turn-helix domain-containing protein [Clostridia bacterium]
MTDYETPRKLILTKPRSSETAEMGMTRERCFDTPSVLKSILDYVACTGWHRCSTAYIIEHSESNPDNIVFVTHGGCGILEIGSVEYRLTADTIAVVPAHTAAKYYTDPESGEWEFRWMHVRGVNVTNILSVLYRNNIYVIPIDRASLFAAIYEEILMNRFSGNEMALFNSRKISELLHLFVEATVSKGIILADNNDFVKTVVHYIEGNYMNPMTSEDIARYVYLSKEYTIRTFKRLTGYSPHAYLKKYRLMKACDYLSDTSLSIKDIAGRVGYRSESNFIAEFKGEKGVTPSRFRKSKYNFNDKQ